VELQTSQDEVITTFIETQGDSSDRKCFLPETRFRRVDGGMVPVEQLRQGERLDGPLGEAIVDDIVVQREERRGIVSIRLHSVIVIVTQDHRMCLPGGVFRAAQDLATGDILTTTEGEQPILDILSSTEELAVFAVVFRNDRPVYFAMPVQASVQVAAFGHNVRIDEDFYMHFKFKGAVCEETDRRFSAERWVQEHSDALSQHFDVLFLASDPYSMWVPRDSADEFYKQIKELLKERGPRGSRIRRSRPLPLSPVRPEGIQTPPPLTP